MDNYHLKEFLDRKVIEYNRPDFISNDPVSIPHLFSKKQDIEIAGFFAAIFSWGNRTTIIQKSKELMQMMDNAPHEFCLNHNHNDLKKLTTFKHRTFNATDLLYFVQFLKYHYQKNKSLEDAFFQKKYFVQSDNLEFIESALNAFYHYFFSLEDPPSRTRKHIASPQKKSTCKRLNMFLRWMVRRDNHLVDFGIWKKISPAQLVCPIDIHVSRVAKKIGFVTRKQTDWQTALELTDHLRTLDEADPVKYDFALFGLGVMEHY
ncbi:MAG: TIGR02757 family protein [Bacteroidetes bacterium]|nr:TIGR02757 family protein [Bacteroidota bacterium]